MTEQTGRREEALPAGSEHTLRNTFKVMRDHYQAYEDLFGEYGDTARLKALNGDIIATRNSDHIKQIFAQNPMCYDPFAADTVVPLVGQGSLFTLTGEAHRRERRLLMPCFHGERMRAYGQLMHEAASEELHRALSQGGSATVYPLMNRVSMEVIIRAVFGITGRALVEEVRHAVTRAMDALHPVFLFSKAMQRPFFGVGPYAKFRRRMDEAEAMLYQEMERKEAQQRDEEAQDGEDILSLLLRARDEEGRGLSRESIRDHLFTLLAAGHETTAIAMTWTIYHLLRHPEMLRRVRAEVDEAFERGASMDEIAKLPYLTAVWKEALRIHPIVPDVLRMLTAPMDLGPYRIEAGKVVSVAISAIHHDPEVYDEPEKFKPERFLERQYKPWEYMPFGGGHRRCVGAAFAGFEMGVVLATWLREVEMELLETKQVTPKRRNLTIAPSSPIKVALRRRSQE